MVGLNSGAASSLDCGSFQAKQDAGARLGRVTGPGAVSSWVTLVSAMGFSLWGLFARLLTTRAGFLWPPQKVFFGLLEQTTPLKPLNSTFSAAKGWAI
ncbi:MAG: hypothetical protein CM15mP120_29170 [Pseudomonadota bacterium]|nr:MAG: hypothetical protein CM15mP120_29170 [Pseudomonadota bacterium]